jgi:lipopolysaccharide export system permease protein
VEADVLGLLHRSIFIELTKVFLLAFIGLTGLLLLAGVIAEATRNGLGPTQILAAIPLLIPSTIPYTLPTTTLFATCIIYGRLASDNEILALRAAGVHIRHAILPAIALGVLASVTTFVLFLDLIPYTHYILRSQITGDVRELMYGLLKRESCIRHPRLSYEIHVTRVDGHKLKDAEFRHRDGNGGYDTIALAKEAQLLVDIPHKKIYVEMKNCHIIDSKGNVPTYVESKVWPVEIPEDLTAQAKSRPSDMTWAELFDARDKIQQESDRVRVEKNLHAAAQHLKSGPEHFPEFIRQKDRELNQLALKTANIDAEIYQRPAFALGCLCFVLVGCPVGIWFSRSDYLSAFITCFLPIVIVYYPLMLCGINMVRSGKLVAALGIGAADTLMLVAAFLMHHRLARS